MKFLSSKNKPAVFSLAVLMLAGIVFYGYKTGWFSEKPTGSGTPVASQIGLEISVFAAGLDKPRVVTFDSAGRMLVSETSAGRVSILEDKDKNGLAESRKVLIDKLNKPHGLAFYSAVGKEYLYISESNKVKSYLYDAENASIDRASAKDIANLPDGGRHFTRTISFGPNLRSRPVIEGYIEGAAGSGEKLYISVGSSCDVCEESTWKRAAILESDPNGTYTAEFAGGLRNSVFFTFQPSTGLMWATEMGRDNLGDDLPPDEINIIRPAGPDDKFGAKRYGWPFCYGNKITDNSFKPTKFERIDIPQDCSNTESPVIEIQAHSAPLGLAFVNSDKWPKEWQGNLLVAYHGSWNRSEKTGYKVVRYILDKNNRVIGQEDIINWLEGSKVLGRPVDLKFGPDGALYISDDYTGKIYKVLPL